MKTRLIWRKCSVCGDKDSLWIECTDEEVAVKIIPNITGDISDFLKTVSQNRGKNILNENPLDVIYTNFFMVSFDSSHIMSYQWLMPYSGQWNAYCPFIQFEPIVFDSLAEIKDIIENIQL